MSQDTSLAAPSETSPWLLYAYPWMPYPRRVIIYLRERGIPDYLVRVVHVNDPKNGNNPVDNTLPPRPKGSLPILAIPLIAQGTKDEEQQYTYIRQSLAIMYFLEEHYIRGTFGALSSGHSFLGHDALSRARVTEILALADECTTAWNPVRTFGTGAGTVPLPEASKEMLRWLRRSLMTLEKFMQDRDMCLLKAGTEGHVNMGDVVLFQFFEFVDDCYGVDLTIGSGEIVRDVYNREVKEEFPKLVDFYQSFKTRDSARRDASKGETPPEYAAKRMQSWVEGVL